MPGRHTCSLPQAASETSDAVLLFFIGFPHKQSYTVSQRLAYCPHLALQWGVNILALMHSWFSLVFHLHFIMLGEMSLRTFLRTSVNKIGMFPNSFVMRCNGAPLSCGANPVWGNFGISIRAGLVCWCFLCDFGRGRDMWSWAEALQWLLGSCQLIWGRKKVFLFTHFEREGVRFISHTTFVLLQGYLYQSSEPQRGIPDVTAISRYHLLDSRTSTTHRSSYGYKNPALPECMTSGILGKTFTISHFVMSLRV